MWIYIVLAVPVFLLTIAIIGRFLPETYRARARLETSLTAEELWERLRDQDHYPMSGKMCKRTELLPEEDGHKVWLEHMGSSTLRMRDLETQEPASLLRRVEDTVVPFEARARFTIEDRGNVRVLTCDNESHVRSGSWHVPFFRFAICVFSGVRRGVKDYLTRLVEGEGKFEWA